MPKPPPASLIDYDDRWDAFPDPLHRGRVAESRPRRCMRRARASTPRSPRSASRRPTLGRAGVAPVAEAGARGRGRVAGIAGRRESHELRSTRPRSSRVRAISGGFVTGRWPVATNAATCTGPGDCPRSRPRPTYRGRPDIAPKCARTAPRRTAAMRQRSSCDLERFSWSRRGTACRDPASTAWPWTPASADGDGPSGRRRAHGIHVPDRPRMRRDAHEPRPHDRRSTASQFVRSRAVLDSRMGQRRRRRARRTRAAQCRHRLGGDVVGPGEDDVGTRRPGRAARG